MFTILSAASIRRIAPLTRLPTGSAVGCDRLNDYRDQVADESPTELIGSIVIAGESPELAVVVRYTHYDGATPDQCVDLMSWHQNPVDADAEAARLNLVRRNERVEYFVKLLRDRRAK